MQVLLFHCPWIACSAVALFFWCQLFKPVKMSKETVHPKMRDHKTNLEWLAPLIWHCFPSPQPHFYLKVGHDCFDIPLILILCLQPTNGCVLCTTISISNDILRSSFFFSPHFQESIKSWHLEQLWGWDILWRTPCSRGQTVEAPAVGWTRTPLEHAFQFLFF